MKKLQGHASLIVAFIAVFAAMTVAFVSGDYFFDLNDDVLMKDILSGAYTGVPEGHNIQMLYPISLFISLLYRIGVNIDWYGIFLCACQYFCFGVLIYESVLRVSGLGKKVAVAALEVLAILGFFLPHLLFVQYTVVCGLLSATAAFLIVVPNELKLISFENVAALVMLTVAYLLRSEMLLLTLPMVGVAILIKWVFVTKGCRCNSGAGCENADGKKAFITYVGFCGCIVALLLVSTLLNKIAYSSTEWKEFNRFFDNRTELYDFQYIPEYEENAAFYDSIGLSKSQQQLLVNYNFGLDDEINADVLKEVADYAASLKGEQAPFGTRLKTALGLYFYRLHHLSQPASYEYPMTDFPWNAGVFVMYLVVLIAAICGGMLWPTIGLLAVLFACRSALWLFIIMRGRDPIRITHPLYLVEMFILAGILLYVAGKKTVVAFAVVALIGAVALPAQLQVTAKEQALREEMLTNYGALEAYAKQHEDSFYFYDVYTSVSYAAVADGEVATYSQKLFADVDNSCYNRDILGGWASKSSLTVKKLKNAGFDSTMQALLDSRVYFVQNKTEDTDWLVDFYADKGYTVDVTQIDVVADIFAVYSVVEE